MICHQPPSPDFPVIWELAPTFKPLRTIQPMPGPRRQLTATSLGSATGTDGVKVAVGGGVFEGREGSVGATVDVACVADGVIRASVGVAVATLEGRLQASIAKTSIRTGNNVLDFIVSPLILSYLTQSSSE